MNHGMFMAKRVAAEGKFHLHGYAILPYMHNIKKHVRTSEKISNCSFPGPDLIIVWESPKSYESAATTFGKGSC